jgi:diaminohydroxyphosphoribosylaminopyrimidine deaminase/5-amino-6-(5-phosphoribosylamino)uracil reductase
VAGNGIKKTNGRGINVTVGILKTNAMSLINDFTSRKKKTLHYFKMGRKSGWFYRAKRKSEKPVWITNQYSRQLVQNATEEQAILELRL